MDPRALQTIQDRNVVENIALASLMLCKPPMIRGGRLMLSACDAIWETVNIEDIPDDQVRKFTDEIGNPEKAYAGNLQIVEPTALEELDKGDIYPCFRGVLLSDLKKTGTVPNSRLYENIIRSLVLVGWDVCVGNGWISASYEGIYPINPFSGEFLDGNSDQINLYGLFDQLSDCTECCSKNNDNSHGNEEWYPVAIYLTVESIRRLNCLIRSTGANMNANG
jgi:hypothetical protein